MRSPTRRRPASKSFRSTSRRSANSCAAAGERGRQGYLTGGQRFPPAVGGAKPETQIHTHLGYSSISRVVDAFEAMDADVVSVVATRHLDWVFAQLAKGTTLSHGVGPGVYESRSALIPEIDEIDDLIQLAARYIDPKRLWVNPDGGLPRRATTGSWSRRCGTWSLLARRERRRVESGDDD